MSSKSSQSATTAQEPQEGFGNLLSAISALPAAALTLGVLFGLADSLLAEGRVEAIAGWTDRLGCYGAAILHYSLLFAVGLLLLVLVFQGRLARMSASARLGRLLFFGLFVGGLAEIYWWTRPFVFEGLSALSVQRLSVLGVQALAALLLAWIAAKLLMRLPRGVHLGLRTLGVLAWLTGGWFLIQDATGVEGRGVLNDRNRDLPNVLLVVVDALRADHLACYGARGVETPHIDALAERGVLVETCYAQSPTTLPSFGSILTGKYPRRHGLVDQRAGVRMRPNVTLAHHLKSARFKDGKTSLRSDDYATGSFMTGAVSTDTGLARGFDAYSEAMLGHDLVRVDSAWSQFRSELLLWLFKNKLGQRVDSAPVVSTARGWIREHRDRRWMALVHLYSTHIPYDPPADLRREYLDASYEGPIESFRAEHSAAFENGSYVPSEGDVQQVRNLYRAGAAFADQMVGELVAELEELELLEDTLIVFTSDHGEDLGEWRPSFDENVPNEGSGSADDRVWEHGHMWQTNLRIPLILANTRRLPHGARVTSLVESVDFLPTLCDLLNLELPVEDGIAPQLDGASFLPVVLGTQVDEASDFTPRRYSYSESQLFLSIQDLQAKLIVPRDLVQDADAERLYREPHRVRFYRLDVDPNEQHALFDGEDRKLREMWMELRDYDRRMPDPVYLITESSPEYRQLLRDLGYAGEVEAKGSEESED